MRADHPRTPTTTASAAHDPTTTHPPTAPARRVASAPPGSPTDARRGPLRGERAPSSVVRRPTPRAGNRIRRFVPRQHGAWAMLGVPFVVGAGASGPAPVHVPLLIAWVGAYLLSFYAFQALKTRRPGRVQAQLVVYSAVTVPAAAIALATAPGLWAFAPPLAGLAAVTAWHAWRRDERSIVNDLAAVAQACLGAPIAAVAGGLPAGSVWGAAGILFLYFAGTGFYVKTMIRERGSVGWRWASVAFHTVAAGVAWLAAWPLGALFTWLLVRAAVLPSRRLSPRAVGSLEIGNSVALLVLLIAGRR